MRWELFAGTIFPDKKTYWSNFPTKISLSFSTHAHLDVSQWYTECKEVFFPWKLGIQDYSTPSEVKSIFSLWLLHLILVENRRLFLIYSSGLSCKVEASLIGFSDVGSSWLLRLFLGLRKWNFRFSLNFLHPLIFLLRVERILIFFDP